MSPEMGAAASGFLDRLLAALAPWQAKHAYLNFRERPADAATLFPPETYARLRQVKRRYDPRDVIRSNHPIPPA